MLCPGRGAKTNRYNRRDRKQHYARENGWRQPTIRSKNGVSVRGNFLFLDFVFDNDTETFLFLDDHRITLFSDNAHRRSKAIATLGNSFDVSLLLPIVAQSPARRGHVLRQIVLFDKDIGPDNLD